MKKYSFALIVGIISILFTISCGKDEPEDPIIPNEEELITTVTYTLTPHGGGNVVTLTFEDLDGDGGNAPIITDGVLIANTTYDGKLVLLNEVASPTENITEEVEEEGVDHQFFFQSSISDVTVAYDDEDANGNPIGLSTILTTNEAGEGTITVTLRHEPAKTEPSVSTGDITNAGGETDIEITFNVEVQ